MKLYTYNPFGEIIEKDDSFANPFRFTGRDPARGKYEEPMEDTI